MGLTSQSLSQRWRDHVFAATRGVGGLLGVAIRRHGKHTFTHEELERVDDRALAAATEIWWIAHLDCRTPRGLNLSSGGAAPVGPLRHGHSRRTGQSPEYTVWKSMIQRCTNPNVTAYTSYGGRGVQVASAWRGRGGFERFLLAVGPRPSMAHTLDRWPNRDGDYAPGNVRWATLVQQARNKRTNHTVEFRGERLTIAELAERLGVRAALIQRRLVAGWDAERAVTMPPRHNTITFRGETRTVCAWARHLGLNVKTVVERLRRGWPVERALTESPSPALANRVPGVNRDQRRRAARELRDRHTAACDAC